MEIKMNNQENLNHALAAIGWGLLFIWWGVVVLIDPITMGTGAIGTGLILLGVNAARWTKGIPTRASTTTVGITALAWGILDQGRILLGLDGGVSFASFLIVIGVVVFLLPLLKAPRAAAEGLGKPGQSSM